MLIRFCLPLLCILALTTEAHAQSLSDEAAVHFSGGIEAYRNSDFDAALRHFLLSNRLAPNPNVSTNIGHTYLAMKRPAEAYRWYSLALKLAEDEKSKASLRKQMDALSAKVVLFDLASDPPGATVYLDRRTLGAVATTPATIALPKGDYAFIFELPDHGVHTVPSTAYDKIGARHTVAAPLTVFTGTLSATGLAGAMLYDGDADGVALCQVPCAAELPVGEHTLTFTKGGYRKQIERVTIERGTTLGVEAAPEQITGTIQVDSNVDSALVTVDGEAVGYTPTIVSVPVGARIVQVDGPGYRSEAIRVEVEDGKSANLGRVRLEPRQTVTLASRVEEDLFTAPSSVSTVTASELNAFGYPTVLEALRGVRGVSVINADLDSMVMIRGVGTASNRGTQTKSLLNGAALTDQLTGRQYLYSRSQNVDHIEVQRGSGSVLYGSGALTGLVATTSRGRTDGITGRGSIGFFGSEARLSTLGSVGDEEKGGWISVGAVHGAGDSAAIPFSVVDPDGAGPEAATLAPISRNIEHYSPWKGVQVEARGWYEDGEAWAQYATDAVELTSGVDGTVLENQAGEVVSNPASVEQLTIGASYRPALSDRTDLDLNAYFRQATSENNATWARSTAGVPIELLVAQQTIARWVGGTAQVSTRPIDEVRIVAGGEAYRSVDLSLSQDSQIWLPDEDRYSTSLANYSFKDAQSVYAVYAVADVQPNKYLKASAGLRVDKWFAQAPQANPRLVGMVIPTEDDIVKIMVGRAFRAPVTFEQKYFVESISVPAQDLSPESGWSYELEYTHKYQEWTALASGWAATYHNVITSTIDPNAGGLRRYGNVDGDSQVYGVDAEVRRDFLNGSMFNVWYSYQRSRSIDGDGVSVNTPEQPNHLAAFKLVTPIVEPGLNAAVRVVYEGARPYRDGSLEGEVPAAVLADLVFSGRSRNGVVGWRAGVYNALATNFSAATLNSTVSPVLPQTRGRTFMASIEFSGKANRRTARGDRIATEE